MTIALSQAVSAYANAARSALSSDETGAAPTRSPGEGFAELVQKSLSGAIDAQHQGEQATLQAAAGKADLGQVVTAITNAEVTLQTVVAVRDKVVSAYQEIMRMPV